MLLHHENILEMKKIHIKLTTLITQKMEMAREARTEFTMRRI